jgi:crotonobetainyl-CoA:carnitine CoA-transferase CaiB-like acyl-CoA transferase
MADDPTLPFRALPALARGAGFDLLAGVRVLDLTGSIAGPYATLLLADLGAEVIKIERAPAGDDTRAWGPPFLDGESLWFLSANRNKRSMALDIAKPDGLAVLHDLVRKSDVVAVNQPPRVAAKLGIDPATLQRLKADLIYVSITGFGLAGERADWTCYDLIAEGYSGIMDLTGELDGDPQKVGAPAADMLAGEDAALATVAALFRRAQTGQGRVIDVALVDSMTRFLGSRVMSYLGSGELPRRSGGKDSVIAIYQAFDTADQPLTLALGNDAIWRRFWEAVGEPAAADTPGWSSNVERRGARAAIVARIQALLRTRPRDHWLACFRAARVPAGPINRVDEVAADPALQARGLLYRLDAEDGRQMPQIGTGFLLDGQPNRPRTAPPKLGADTDAVLRDLLGYDAAKRDALAKAGVV